MASTVRVPTELYQALREIRLSLESEYFAASPTMQDLVSVAIRRFIEDLDDSEELSPEKSAKRTQIIEELLKSREKARSKMGKPSDPKQ